MRHSQLSRDRADELKNELQLLLCRISSVDFVGCERQPRPRSLAAVDICPSYLYVPARESEGSLCSDSFLACSSFFNTCETGDFAAAALVSPVLTLPREPYDEAGIIRPGAGIYLCCASRNSIAILLYCISLSRLPFWSHKRCGRLGTLYNQCRLLTRDAEARGLESIECGLHLKSCPIIRLVLAIDYGA